MPQDRTAPKTKIIQTMDRFPPARGMRLKILAIRRRAVPYYGQKHGPVFFPGVSDPYPMAHLRDRGDRFRVRYLRTSHASPDPAARARTTRRADVRDPGFHPMARP